ncbi:MAG TPA: isochorismatase family cysteine hydrolase [Solirubrobacterales bacterium]|nr:isochorismatase family cysteine hydrolase [Solirubrobacterales bacterium]
MAEHPQRGDRTCLLVIDMLNTYDHEDGDRLAESVRAAVPQIVRLIGRARDEDAPIVYVNDNHGDWRTHAEELSRRALAGRHPDLVEPVLPGDADPFVLKTRHSVFYSTALEYLLESMGVGRIVLTGQVTEQCILYSAVDGYVGHFEVSVPRDAVAHIYEHLADASLEMMERNMHAEVGTADEITLRRKS